MIVVSTGPAEGPALLDAMASAGIVMAIFEYKHQAKLIEKLYECNQKHVLKHVSYEGWDMGIIYEFKV